VIKNIEQPPKIVEVTKVMEVPVDRIVEKFIDKIVEVERIVEKV
jgi:hypothetical protein